MENTEKEQIDEKIIEVATKILLEHKKVFEVLGNG